MGLLGSLLAGVISLALFGGENAGGLILSVACATLIVYFVRKSRGHGLSSTTREPF